MMTLGKTSTQLLRAIDKARDGGTVIFVYDGNYEMHRYYEDLCLHLCSMRNVKNYRGVREIEVGRGAVRLVRYSPENPPPSQPHIIVDHRVVDRMRKES